ncbi:MAG: DNA repair protein RadA [Bacillota bacterium]
MKKKIHYVCRNCGGESPKWMGRCSVCGQWNTYDEVAVSAGAECKTGGGEGAVPKWLADVSLTDQPRLVTGISEMDRALGGGIVLGSLVLLGGEPGIGKSTLLMQMAGKIAEQNGMVLYISGEESAVQIKMRSQRLGLGRVPLLLLVENNYDVMEKEILKHRPLIVIVDSIQAIAAQSIQGLPGSVTQVRECAGKFLFLAKQTGIPIFLIGHITKSGILAGPKVLEHMVDTVLYFEGDTRYLYRILRVMKNRFGATNEMGVFIMQNEGLKEIPNPSSFFLESRPLDASGSVITAGVEGTRPYLVEIQALVSGNNYGGPPRRLVTGLDYNRVAMILAVLEKKLGWPLGTQDIYVSAVGGMILEEPAADLSVACAVASSWRNKPIDSRVTVCGEIGLSGEIRSIPHIGLRVREAVRLGFSRIILPKSNFSDVPRWEKVSLEPVEKLSEALKLL